MKKIIIISLALFLNMTLFSCSEGQVLEEIPETQACCDGNGELPPPPPPPPTPTNGGG